MTATDMGGSVARAIDRRWPESSLGSSSKGAMLDKYADTTSMIIVSGTALMAEYVSNIGKHQLGLS